jgi:Resolvase, N terminal domain
MGEKRASRKTKSPKVFGHPPRRAKAPFRVVFYARVSTHDQETQTRALREYVAQRGWAITVQVKEVGSVGSQRELWEKLLEVARRRAASPQVYFEISLCTFSTWAKLGFYIVIGGATNQAIRFASGVSRAEGQSINRRYLQ